MNSIFRSGKFFSPSLSSQVHKIINPATLELIAEITPGSKADVDLAVDAAQSALSGEWKWFSGRSRRDMMYKIADNIQANFDEYVNIEVENVGKPTIDAACDIKDTIELYGKAVIIVFASLLGMLIKSTDNLFRHFIIQQ